jgi:hypothetical protein
MCDDDNWLAENYVTSAYEIMSEGPNIGALGGLGKLLFEIDPPAWELSDIFAGGTQGLQSGKVTENKVYGAGCVIRNSAYQKLLRSGFKSLLTDRKSNELSSGGDYELCFALAIMGYDIWYDERLRFTHFITQERLSWDYYLRYAYESSKSFNVLSSYKMVASRAKINRFPRFAVLRNFFACSKIFFGINVRRIAGPEPYLQKSLYFRHLIFKYKFLAYFTKFQEMVRVHKHIVKFQQNCRPSQHILRPLNTEEYRPSLKPSSSSKPFLPLR